MLIIVPSRGRPHKIAELISSFEDTRMFAELRVVIDGDDPTLAEYEAIELPEWAMRHVLSPGLTGSMVAALNTAARVVVASRPDHKIIGFMGDDHRPRTHHWDKHFADALESLHGGIVYGNDLFQGWNLPTHCVMDARIIQAVGYMAPPELTHLYVDNYWKALGEGVGIKYLGDVIIEHVHPAAGKTEWDEGYVRVNAGELYEKDGRAWEAYRSAYLTRDIKCVMEAMA
jgi:hypothetical protein